MRKKRHEKKAARLARAFVSLDEAARDTRPSRLRRAQFTAFSTAGVRRPS